MAMFGFPHWQLKSTSTESGVVAPDERLPFAQTAVMGVQHAVAMFGATVLMPILMGLDPNLSILMSVKRRTKNAKTFHDKCENFNFRASNETAALTAVFLFITWGHFGYG